MPCTNVHLVMLYFVMQVSLPIRHERTRRMMNSATTDVAISATMLLAHGELATYSLWLRVSVWLATEWSCARTSRI